MHYLLTKDEYHALIDAAERDAKAPTREDLQKFCTLVADRMPIILHQGSAAKPWGCILTHKHEWYCDECPARNICPFEDKSWSK